MKEEQENGGQEERNTCLWSSRRERCVCVCVFDHCLIGLRSAPGRVNREGRNAFAPWSMSSICQGVCEGC